VQQAAGNDDPALGEHLFSYGTLQLESVQIATFGRRLTGSSDALEGYVLEPLDIEDELVIAISGKSEHTVARFTGSRADVIEGTVFSVSPTDIDHADGYETPARQRSVVTLRSGTRAWAYVESELDASGN